MPLATAGITADVIRGMMPPYRLATDLPAVMLAAVPPAADTPAGWRHARAASGPAVPAATPAWPDAPVRPRAGKPHAVRHNPMQQPATGIRPGGELVAVAGAPDVAAACAAGAAAGPAVPTATPAWPDTSGRPRAGGTRAAWHNPMQQPATGPRSGGEPVAVVGAPGVATARGCGAAHGPAAPTATAARPDAPARPRAGETRAARNNPMQEPATGPRSGGEPVAVVAAAAAAAARAGGAAHRPAAPTATAAWPEASARPRAGETRAARNNPMQQPATGLRPGGEPAVVAAAAAAARAGGAAPRPAAPTATAAWPEAPARPRAGETRAARNNPMQQPATGLRLGGEPAVVAAAAAAARAGGAAPRPAAPTATAAWPEAPARPRAGETRTARNNPMQQPATGLRPGGEPAVVAGAVGAGSGARWQGGGRAGDAVSGAGVPEAPARPWAGGTRTAWHNPMQREDGGYRAAVRGDGRHGAAAADRRGACHGGAGWGRMAGTRAGHDGEGGGGGALGAMAGHNPMQQPATGPGSGVGGAAMAAPAGGGWPARGPAMTARAGVTGAPGAMAGHNPMQQPATGPGSGVGGAAMAAPALGADGRHEGRP